MFTATTGDAGSFDSPPLPSRRRTTRSATLAPSGSSTFISSAPAKSRYWAKKSERTIISPDGLGHGRLENDNAVEVTPPRNTWFAGTSAFTEWPHAETRRRREDRAVPLRLRVSA